MILLLPALASLASWLADMASWLVARTLYSPEPLVHATSLLVFALVQAVVTSVGKSLCPRRLARRLGVLWRAIH